MCTYCKNFKTGNDYKPFYENNIKGDINGYVSVYLSRTCELPTISVDLTVLNTPIIGDSFIINFCPICGKYLREEIDDRK